MNFQKALDAHITGIYDHSAPFNQTEPPVCETCPLEKCPKVCQKYERYLEEQAKIIRKMEESLRLYEYDEEVIG